MPEIRVLIFRGTGGVFNENHPHYHEPALVRAGHVGIEGIIPDKIIGFHPTEKATQEAGGEIELLRLLGQHQAQPGMLQDDTAIFERAHALIPATRGRTTVYMYSVEISDGTFEEIKQWYTERQESSYNFPKRDGTFGQGESNCALFLIRFDISLPRLSGNIREIVETMIVEDYEQWIPMKK